MITALSVVSVADAMTVEAGAGQAAAADAGGGGSSQDHSSDETTLGVIGIGAAGQNNCTLCAGAITQEVSCSSLKLHKAFKSS